MTPLYPIPASAALARNVWLRVRPEGFAWYHVEGELRSPTSIHLWVYDMYSNLYGGIGDLLREQDAELVGQEVEDAKRVIHKAQLVLAERELDRRAARARQLQIENMRDHMFGAPLLKEN